VILVFYSSSSTIICNDFSWRGSNWVCLAYLLFCAVFNYFCMVFISCVPFNHSVMLMAFCHFFNFYIEVLIFSSCWSSCWTFSSSSNIIHSCVVLSKIYVTFLASLSIISISMASCCSLSTVTLGGVVGVNVSLSSLIYFLYSLSVYAR
jgi:hypothetical protein